jgi:hypothetical protein
MVNYKVSGGFLVQIIVLTTKMLNLGFFYDFKQYVRLFESLKNILTKTDQIVLNVSEGNLNYEHVKTSKLQFKDIEIPASILDIKKRICQILKIMIMVQNDFKINDIIKTFKDEMKTETNKGGITGMSENQNLLSQSLGRNRPGNNSKMSLIASKMIKGSKMSDNKFMPIFEDEYQNKSNQFITKDRDFITMLETQTLFHNDDLKSIALDLLYSLFKTTDFLSEMVVDLQVIENSDQVKEFESLQEIRNYLFRLGETIETWYPINSEKEISHILLLLNRLEIMIHDKKFQDEEKVEAVSGIEQNSEIDKKLEKNPYLMINLNNCFLNLNKFSQDLVRNIGIIDDLLEILSVVQSYPMTSVQTSLNIKKKRITFLLHLILAEVCHENKVNTEYLNQYINTLILPYRTHETAERVPGLDRKVTLGGEDSITDDSKLRFKEFNDFDEIIHAP